MRPVLLLSVVLVALGCLAAGAWFGYGSRETVLAMEWGDGRYGKTFYGAKVVLEADGKGYAVRGVVLIAPDALGDVSYRHECGVIGHVADFAEATERYGVVVWKPDGLHVGPYFLPRARFENHR